MFFFTFSLSFFFGSIFCGTLRQFQYFFMSIQTFHRTANERASAVITCRRAGKFYLPARRQVFPG